MEQLFDGTDYVWRLIYDSLFSTLCIVAVLNIVQGVISDKFTTLRTINEEFEEDRKHRCFVCGLSKSEIERASSVSFADHRSFEHNFWNYLYFIAYLKSKKRTDYTGIESYVMEQVDRNEDAWVPLKRGLSIKIGSATESDKTSQHLAEAKQNLGALSTTLARIDAEQQNK